MLVLDRADFPRDKVCGDGIAPEALDVLAGLGLDPAALTAGLPAGAAAAAALPRRDDVERATAPAGARRAARGVRRAAAGRGAGHGAEFRRHAVRTLAVAPHARGDRRRARRAGVVVGADGAESVVRRALGIAPNPPDRLAVAIRGYAPEPAGQDGVQVLATTEQRWPAYAWSFPLGDGRANVGYGELVVRRRHPRRAARRPAPAAARRRAEQAARAPAAAVHRPARGSPTAGCCSPATPRR